MKNVYLSASLVLLISAISASCSSDDPQPSGSGGSATSGTGGFAETGDTEDTDDTDDSTTGQTGGQGGADDICANLGEVACTWTADCSPIFGYQPDADAGWPVMEPASKTYLDCRYSGSDASLCTDSLPCARDAGSPEECWMFSNGCIPPDWEFIQCQDPCMESGQGGAGGDSSTP